MTIIRTAAGLTHPDFRRLTRGRFEILAIETRHRDHGDTTEIVWSREDGPDAIPENEVPF